MNTKEFIIEQCRKYPKMQPNDLYKALYQSVFGCGHLVNDPSAAADFIRREAAFSVPNDTVTEPLDGDYTRVYLSSLSEELSASTFAELFALSAKQPCGDICSLEEKLNTATACINELPFKFEQWDTALKGWRKEGFPACHHSPEYRNAYHPAYRLLHNSHVPFLPLFTAIDRKCAEAERVIVAIEGSSASGKSTLAKLLESVYDCNIFHMDDFFLQEHQRTEQRFAEIGGNVDYERFADEIMTPLIQGKQVVYRPFDCSTFTLREEIILPPKKLNIVEGAYSMHPTLEKNYDISVFLKIDPQLQKKRIQIRNTPFLQEKFFHIWIPMERRYFAHTDIEKRCTLTVEVK